MMANLAKYVVGSGEDAGNNGRVQFELENTGERPVEITSLTVDWTDSNADIVDNDGSAEFEGTGGFINKSGSIGIGDTTPTILDESAIIGGQMVDIFRLGQFRQSKNNNSVNLNKKDIRVTLLFSDGSRLTFTAENL